MELFVGFKFEDTADLDSEAAQSLSGHLSSYVAALSGLHFRVLICGKLARIICWDRNDAIVSRAFNYTKFLFPQHVERRGHDPTVTITSTNEVTKCDKTTIGYNDGLCRRFWILRILECGDGSRESEFLVSYSPKYASRLPFGRATRQMVAYDLKQSHIAPFGKGNDFRDNITITDQLRDEFSTCEMVAPRNYRLSLGEVGRRLTEFKSSREFVKAVADAMKAHDAAFFDAGILHRDISVGNVIITAEGEGALLDWDICINYRKQDMTAHRPDRTGTWQFMSAALLSQLRSDQKIDDDRESAFWVLLYLGLRYTKHNQIQELEPYMNIFDYVAFADNEAEGGQLKSNFLVAYSPADALAFQCSPLNGLIEELLTTLSVRYENKPSAAAFANYQDMKRNPNTSHAAFLYHPAALYEAHNNDLRERGWLVNVIDKYLAGADWPDADAAELNPTSKKRKRLLPWRFWYA